MKPARTLALGVAVVAVLSLAAPAAAAHADTSPLPVVAADTSQPVIAADTTPAPGTRPVALVGVDPDIVNGLTVTGHLGHPGKATAKGQRTHRDCPREHRRCCGQVVHHQHRRQTRREGDPVAGRPATNLVVT
jgi:hypothetical protein